MVCRRHAVRGRFQRPQREPLFRYAGGNGGWQLAATSVVEHGLDAAPVGQLFVGWGRRPLATDLLRLGLAPPPGRLALTFAPGLVGAELLQQRQLQVMRRGRPRAALCLPVVVVVGSAVANSALIGQTRSAR